MLVAGRTTDKIAQVAGAIAEGGSAEPVTTDVTSESDVVGLFDRAMAPGDGRPPADLVVYNAGNNRRSISGRSAAEQFESSGVSAASAAFWSVARRRAAWSRSGAARSSSPALRQPARQARVCAFRGRQGGAARDRAEHGARIRAARHPCRACGDRRRHPWRAAAQSHAAARQERGEDGLLGIDAIADTYWTSIASTARPGRKRSICAPTRSPSEVSILGAGTSAS